MATSNQRTHLAAQRGVALDYLRALRAWGFKGSVSIEFTQDGETPEATYENCVSDLAVVKEALS